jgi:hypothetical protein
MSETSVEHAEVEHAVGAYRAELEAGADYSAADLDELEDHLRALIEVERLCGRTTAEAVEAARARLGAPAELAREHARVRSPFGARIGRARAWSAAALLIPFLFVAIADIAQKGTLLSPTTVEVVLGCALLAALVARLSWARMFIAGSLASSLVWMLGWSVAYGAQWFPLRIVCHAGALAFLLPWSRREVTPAGAALGLLGPAYGGATSLVAVQLTSQNGDAIAPWLGLLAVALVLLTGLGALLRSRWTVGAALAATSVLILGFIRVWPLSPRFADPASFRALILGSIALGAASCIASASIARRNARTFAGTLRGLAS